MKNFIYLITDYKCILLNFKPDRNGRMMITHENADDKKYEMCGSILNLVKDISVTLSSNLALKVA
jgi:hypothetical protein